MVTLPTLTRNPNLTYIPESKTLPNEVQTRFGDRWWTGLAPQQCLGFCKESQTLHALPLLNLSLCSRQDVLDYFNNSWTLTELLFAGLKTDSAYTRSPYHQLRHPLIFYYGHPAVLYLNKMRLAGLIEKPVDLYLEKILETGVDEMSWDDMAKNEMLWPKVEEVHAYRKKVYTLVKQVIETHPDLESPQKFFAQNPQNHPLWSLWMGMEHEKIHLETSSVLIRELPQEIVETPKHWAELHPSAKTPQARLNSPIAWKKMQACKVRIGKETNAPSYGWDNEYGHRDVELRDFQYTEKLISNADYYEFVRSGSYIEDRFWKPEGLHWRKFRNTKRPTFWMAVGPEGLHEYKLRTIFSVIDMPWNWPVEVNYHEAEAYCAWKQEQDRSSLKYRLLTEAEHHAARNCNGKDPILQSRHFDDMKAPPDMPANFNLKYGSPSPVDAEVFGNVWQWVEDQFNPLTQFKVHSYYDDFSTPCFDGKHQMIMGGSFISCGHEASVYARFHFRPHFYQHSGFRIAATLDGTHDNGAYLLKSSGEYTHQTRSNILDQMKKENWWQQVEQPLSLSALENEQLFTAVKNRLFSFLNQFSSMSASGSPNLEVPYQASKNFPELPTNAEVLLKSVFDDLLPLSQLPGHPNYAAYLAGSTNMVSALAQLISTTINPFSGHYSFAPGLIQLEAEAIRWFVRLFEYPEKTALGYFTSGGSAANLSAISIARKEKLKPEDYARARVYASDQSHHCIGKAMAILGFSPDSLVLIESDAKNKMNLSALEKQITKDIEQGFRPLMVVGTAGSTNTGTIDPLEGIAATAKKFSLWFHIDGAYGALFKLTEAGKTKLKGLELSDSISFDPHKSMSMPYGTGALIIRDRKHLLYSYPGAKTYMPEENFYDESGLKVDYSEITPELSREWRGFKVWLPLKVFGVGPFILNLEEKLALSKWACEKLKTIRNIEILSEPELTVQTFRINVFSSEEQNRKATELLLKNINASNTLFLSACTLKGQRCIRLSLLSHQMHFGQVQKFVDNLPSLIQQTLREMDS